MGAEGPAAEEGATSSVRIARSYLAEFEDATIEEKHGLIKHSIEELRNARRDLPDDY